jgi:putative ABC transport system permease protein
MERLEPVRQALRQLRAHRTRSLLTMFGLLWGTASLIVLVAWGQGLRVMLERGFFKTGKNMGEVWAGTLSDDYTPTVDRRYLWFTTDDLETLRRRARLPELIAGEAEDVLPAAYRQRSLTVDVRGIEPEVMVIRGVPLAAGRGITNSDVRHRRRVAVLGDDVRRQLLGADGGLGSWIRISGKPFRVVGVLDHVGTQLNRDGFLVDQQVWIPISTLQASWPAWWTSEPVVNRILFRMRDRSLLEETENEVRAILAERLGVRADDTQAVGIHSAVKVLRKIPLDGIEVVLFVLATATLVIGGIGVLSMMLDSVYERRQEIGVRLAVGARRRDITIQFLLETLTVTGLGGLAGVALGVGTCVFLANLDVPDLIPVPILQPAIVMLALGVMSGVGLAAGVIPAWKAAQVDPSVTLRIE